MKRKFFKFILTLCLGFQRICIALGIKIQHREKSNILGDDQHQEKKSNGD